MERHPLMTTMSGDNELRDDRTISLINGSTVVYTSEYLLGISFLNDGSIVAWYNYGMYHSAPLALNLIHNAVLGQKNDIVIINAPLKLHTTAEYSSIEDNFVAFVSIFICFAWSFYTFIYIEFYIKVSAIVAP